MKIITNYNLNITHVLISLRKYAPTTTTAASPVINTHI